MIIYYMMAFLAIWVCACCVDMFFEKETVGTKLKMEVATVSVICLLACVYFVDRGNMARDLRHKQAVPTKTKRIKGIMKVRAEPIPPLSSEARMLASANMGIPQTHHRQWKTEKKANSVVMCDC